MARKRKIRLGRVVSNKMDKTAVVTVESSRHHPKYGKLVRRVTRYKVHDEKNECSPGDTVRLVETRPLSREKRWRVAEIITRAAQIEVKPEELETPSQSAEPEAVGEEPAEEPAEEPNEEAVTE